MVNRYVLKLIVAPLAIVMTGAMALRVTRGDAIAPPADAQATVRWMPERVIEGTVFTVIVDSVDTNEVRVEGEFSGEPLHFTAEEGRLIALAGAALDSTGWRALHVTLTDATGDTASHVLQVPVEAGDYLLEKMSVAPRYGRPQPPGIQRRINEEAARARAVSRASHETPRLWQPPFTPPRVSRVTSGFGHGRTFNGVVRSRHTGVDYAGTTGTPVLAPARGVVALVDTFYLGGGVLYIDHGAGLVTGYLHLSEHEVAQGDTVEAGQVIGRVGATGRVTGPHLHWIVRYGRHSIDGRSLLEVRRDSLQR